MTTVGHLLVGASLCILAMPRDLTIFKKLLVISIFALLVNIPDFPIPGWGHDRYNISHSILVNLALYGLIAFLLYHYTHIHDCCFLQVWLG